MSGVKARVSGRKFREARDAALLTQKAVAAAAGVSLPTIERIERDREGKGVYIRPGTLFELAGALDVDPRELMVEDTSRPLGELGSPLDKARFEAARLGRREAEGEGKLDAFWMGQWGAAEQGVDNMTRLLRAHDNDPVRRREALDLLERFIGLERCALERYLALHGWSLADAVSKEPVEAEERETVEAEA